MWLENSFIYISVGKLLEKKKLKINILNTLINLRITIVKVNLITRF